MDRNFNIIEGGRENMNLENAVRLDVGQELVYITDVRGADMILGFENTTPGPAGSVIVGSSEQKPFRERFIEAVNAGKSIEVDYLILLAPTERGAAPVSMDNPISTGKKGFNTRNIVYFSFDMKEDAKQNMRQFIDTQIRPQRTGVAVVRTNLTM